MLKRLPEQNKGHRHVKITVLYCLPDFSDLSALRKTLRKAAKGGYGRILTEQYNPTPLDRESGYLRKCLAAAMRFHETSEKFLKELLGE